MELQILRFLYNDLLIVTLRALLCTSTITLPLHHFYHTITYKVGPVADNLLPDWTVNSDDIVAAVGACVYMHVCTYVYICMHACMHVYICLNMYLCVYINILSLIIYYVPAYKHVLYMHVRVGSIVVHIPHSICQNIVVIQGFAHCMQNNMPISGCESSASSLAITCWKFGDCWQLLARKLRVRMYNGVRDGACNYCHLKLYPLDLTHIHRVITK